MNPIEPYVLLYRSASSLFMCAVWKGSLPSNRNVDNCSAKPVSRFFFNEVSSLNDYAGWSFSAPYILKQGEHGAEGDG